MPDTVLITGCSSGIGRSTAEQFLADGWTVYATARDPDDIADLGTNGCKTASLDVTVPEDVDRVVDRVIDEQGRIDALINNAGIAVSAALEEVPTEELKHQFDVNVFGGHRLTRAVLPHMREAGHGTIINVSSVAGLVSFPGIGPYTGSKHAIEGLSDALRVEVAPFGIDVVLIEPGWAKTRIDDKSKRKLTEMTDGNSPYDQLHDNVILVNDLFMSDPISGSVDDIAETILEAANADDPEPRYLVTMNGKILSTNRHIPDRLRDWVFGKVFWGPLATIRP